MSRCVQANHKFSLYPDANALLTLPGCQQDCSAEWSPSLDISCHGCGQYHPCWHRVATAGACISKTNSRARGVHQSWMGSGVSVVDSQVPLVVCVCWAWFGWPVQWISPKTNPEHKLPSNFSSMPERINESTCVLRKSETWLQLSCFLICSA